MSDATNRIAVLVRDRPRHIADKNLPGHWENIRVGQTKDERAAAIMLNIKLDERSAARGIDRATGEPLETRSPSGALARLKALRKSR